MVFTKLSLKVSLSLKKTILVFIYIILFILLNRYFLRLSGENIYLTAILFLIFFLYVIGNIKRTNIFKILSMGFQILLIFYQFNQTNLEYIYSNTPAEIDRQIKRVAYYPNKLVKLGYYLELKRETRIFYKLEENIFSALDINLYFPDYFSFLEAFFVFIGIFLYFKKSNLFINSQIFISLLTLTIAGVNSKYGPISIFPLLIYFGYLPFDYLLIQK